MSPASLPIAPAGVSREFVLSKCDYFVEVQLWPIHHDLDPAGWLGNFANDEMEHAVHLLNSFIYFSKDLVNHMMIGAFQGLSRVVLSTDLPYLKAQETWRSFNDRLIITYVTGEQPNPTDSGYLFARKARQNLGISEGRILNPTDALRELYVRGPIPIVFVDDIVGSGQQFMATWRRLVNWGSGSGSFEQFAAVRDGTFYYCPLVCTQQGLERLKKDCPEVLLSPAHVLPPQYSVLAADSLIWPESLRGTALAVLKIASERAGIPPAIWQGFGGLGLAMAFEHSVPDPLVKRS